MKNLLKPEKRIRIVNFVTAALLLLSTAILFINDHTFTYEGKEYSMSIIKFLMFPYNYDPSKAVFKGLPYQTVLEETLTKYSGLVGTAAWINTVVNVAACMFFLGLLGILFCIIFNKKSGGTYIFPVLWCLFGLIGTPMSDYLKLGSLFWVRYALIVITSIVVFWNIALCIKEYRVKRAEVKRLDAERDARWEADRLRRQQEADAKAADAANS